MLEGAGTVPECNPGGRGFPDEGGHVTKERRQQVREILRACSVPAPARYVR